MQVPAFKVGDVVRSVVSSNLLGSITLVSDTPVGNQFLYGVQWLGIRESQAIYHESDLQAFNPMSVVDIQAQVRAGKKVFVLIERDRNRMIVNVRCFTNEAKARKELDRSLYGYRTLHETALDTSEE